jgi:hypothetical protein
MVSPPFTCQVHSRAGLTGCTWTKGTVDAELSRKGGMRDWGGGWPGRYAEGGF